MDYQLRSTRGSSIRRPGWFGDSSGSHRQTIFEQAGHKKGKIRMDLVSPVVQRWIQDARENPEAFWGRAAAQLPWLRTWDRVFEWTPPTFRWFIGGRTNQAPKTPPQPATRGGGGPEPPVSLNESTGGGRL